MWPRSGVPLLTQSDRPSFRIPDTASFSQPSLFLHGNTLAMDLNLPESGLSHLSGDGSPLGSEAAMNRRIHHQ